MNDQIIISYDKGGSDIACLIIGRQYDDRIHILRQFFGTDVEEIYRHMRELISARKIQTL